MDRAAASLWNSLKSGRYTRNEVSVQKREQAIQHQRRDQIVESTAVSCRSAKCRRAHHFDSTGQCARGNMYCSISYSNDTRSEKNCSPRASITCKSCPGMLIVTGLAPTHKGQKGIFKRLSPLTACMASRRSAKATLYISRALPNYPHKLYAGLPGSTSGGAPPCHECWTSLHNAPYGHNKAVKSNLLSCALSNYLPMVSRQC